MTSDVMAQRGGSDFIVEHELGAFLVQDGHVSVIGNVDSLLAHGDWGPPSASNERKHDLVRLVESFVISLPVLLRLGAEMGSIVVRARQVPQGFLIESRDDSGSLLDEEDSPKPSMHRVYQADNQDDLIQTLDCWRWERFHPVEVHSEIAAAVLDAAMVRLNARSPDSQWQIDAWKKICFP